MKRTTAATPVASEKAVILACDVSKDKINVYTEMGERPLERVFANRSLAIDQQLSELATRARRAGAERVLVVAETTGRYHERLLHTALALGLETAWVSGEAVAKMRVVESNDTGKTDRKDPRVIHTLARLGKILRHRVLEEPYLLLREWHAIYETAERGVVEAKCALHVQLRALFPDLSFKKDFFYGPSGRALVEQFGANPHKIVAAGTQRFARGMRKGNPRIQAASLARLYADAQASARHPISPRRAAVLETKLRQLWEDHDRRRREARRTMEALYQEARGLDPRLPDGEAGVIHRFHLARVVAETGPMVAVMRKFLKLLHGWYRSARAFDAQRVFVPVSQFRQAA